MQPRPTVLLALALVALGAVDARAQDTVGQDSVGPDGRVVRRTKLERSCSEALDRFCPELAETPGQTRSQVICLKPYRSSLAPSCRAAVNAAVK